MTATVTPQGEGFDIESSIGFNKYISREDAQAIVDQLWDRGIQPAIAQQAIQQMHAQLQAPPELVFLRNLVTATILKEKRNG